VRLTVNLDKQLAASVAELPSLTLSFIKPDEPVEKAPVVENRTGSVEPSRVPAEEAPKAEQADAAPSNTTPKTQPTSAAEKPEAKAEAKPKSEPPEGGSGLSGMFNMGASMLEGGVNMLEEATGMDIDGDGKVAGKADAAANAPPPQKASEGFE